MLGLVIGQWFGYTASKITGIKFNSEMSRGQRGIASIVGIIVSLVWLAMSIFLITMADPLGYLGVAAALLLGWLYFSGKTWRNG